MKRLLIGLGVVALVVIALVGGLAGFAFLQAKTFGPAIENKVDEFYDHARAQNHKTIYYEMANHDFRSVASYDDFEQFMRKIYGRLGDVKRREKGPWRLQYLAGRSYYQIQYQTTREHGDARELFTFQKSDGGWLLQEYKIDSLRLLLE